jgi:hypothetical protein
MTKRNGELDFREKNFETTEVSKLFEDFWSGRRDLNPGPPAPQAGALARLRHGPNASFYRTLPVAPRFVCYT